MSWNPALETRLHSGCVIPAMPLALDKSRMFDEASQRHLIRYYLKSGVGGLAVAVHTTQFEIRDPAINLFEKVLRTAADEIIQNESGENPILKIAGICGRTDQALFEAKLASDIGYHLGLLSLAAMKGASEAELIRHCKEVSETIPLMGFYLQPAVGGIYLSMDFWRKFFEISNVKAVKIAPFNRYQTLDVLSALAESGRIEEVAVYTGNDDHIVEDLLTPFRFETKQREKTIRIKGGLLGHWAVFTEEAVQLLNRIQQAKAEDYPDLLAEAALVTRRNQMLFDVDNGFRHCISNIQHVLYRQGHIASPCTLREDEDLNDREMEFLDTFFSLKR